MISIIIPTFNEKINVVKIAERIKNILENKYRYEIIFVDDSLDDTMSYLENLSKRYECIRYRHRYGERGLATAVAEGISISNGEIIIVMDADMQHPPELLPYIIKNIERGNDLVIPSRHLYGANEEGLNIFRKIISHTASIIGKIFLKELKNISDPTSGFFAFKKDVVKGVRLNPIGWKILIEVLVRGKYKKVIEIPYEFKKRTYGDSKMSVREQINYIRHVLRLVRYSTEDRRIFSFILVGFSGVFINMFFYNIFINFSFGISVSGTLSALIAMISNFILNRNITWIDKKSKRVFNEFYKFLLVSIFGIGINVAVLHFLYSSISINYNAANLLGICAAVIWNYNLNRFWTWKI